MIISRSISRTIVIATAVALVSRPMLVVAQLQCTARTFTACGVRVENSRVIVQGAAAQPIGLLGWRGTGLARALAGSDSGVHYARSFAARKQRSLALSLLGSVAGSIAGYHIKSIRNTGWIALGAGGAAATTVGAWQGVKAGTALERAVWWYNADATRHAPLSANFPSDSAVVGPLGPLVDAMPGAGVVIGLLEPDGRTRVITHGTSGRRGVPLSDSTVFEIGSVTKVFTAVVLADMVAKREVRLDDPVATYLPPTVRMPSRDGRAITLVDLATHASGLPRNPTNLAAAESGGPFARYDVDRLYAFLSSYGLTRAPGTQFEYSNVAFGLLGHALARHAATSYDALVRARLLDPLGMRDTRIELGPEREARFAAGHAVDGKVVGPWELPTLAGAGAYRSTVADLLRFARANLAADASPLSLTLASARVARRGTPVPGMGMALGWQTYVPDSDTVPAFVWKDGQTGGFASFIGVDAAQHRAVVILANVAGAEALDAVGIALLKDKGASDVASPAPAPTDSVLDTYVGEYELAPAFHMVITRVKHTLYVQATGQNRLTLLPRRDREFDVVGVAARVRFDVDAGGRVASLVLEQGGKSSAARRIR